MTAPRINVKEIDISTRVPSSLGTYAAITIPAPKGDINKPIFVTSDTDLLNYFTPNQKVEVGYNMAFYSALAYLSKANRLWVVRADNGSTYGGLVVRKTPILVNTLIGAITAVDQPNKKFTLAGDLTASFIGVTSINIQGSTGNDGIYTVVSATLVSGDTEVVVSEVVPDATVDGNIYKEVSTINTNIQLTSVEIGAITAVDQPNKKFTLAGDLTVFCHVGDKIRVQSSTGNDGIYTVVSATLVSGDTEVVVSETLASNIVDGTIFRNSLVNPQTYEFQSDDLFLITGANQGSWANDIEVKLFTYANSPDIVKEPDAFQIQVYKQSTGEALEVFTCSRDVNAKDGYGKNIYIEDVLLGSSYIRAIDNTSHASTETIKEQTAFLTLAGALDGLSVTDTNMMNALNTLNNKAEIPLTVIMDGGWATIAYQQAIDSLCQSRKDCVGILSTPYYTEDSSSYMTDIVAYRKTTLNLNSSYSALYTPHVKIRDRFNDRDIFVAPDGYAAAAISDTSSNYEIWFAPAGFKRGMINVLDTKRRFTEGELDLLYDSGINPIKFSVGKGIAIWGQKTLSARPSALDRLNVRLLLITIEPALAAFLEDYLFEFNDDFTRLLIRTGMESYMDNIKSRKGVYDYKVVCDETNNTPVDIDNNIMNVWLFVQPTKTAEFITLSVVITRTGFDLNLAQNLLG